MASGNPLRSSTQAVKIFCTPRFRNSVITESQNFAPCVWGNPHTKQFLHPALGNAQSEIHRLGADEAGIAHFYMKAVQVKNRVDRTQRTTLLLVHILDNGVCHRDYQGQGNIRVVQFL